MRSPRVERFTEANLPATPVKLRKSARMKKGTGDLFEDGGGGSSSKFSGTGVRVGAARDLEKRG